MLQALLSSACRFLNECSRTVLGERLPPPELLPSPAPKRYRRLERVRLTDQVCRTIFDEYGEHQRSERGGEEIGWVLLGVREEADALVLATLPAGTHRNASVAHVHFNSTGQALGSRIVRQWDRRLSMLGVAHTHPGSLRHPSQGDFQGDSLWVGQLRGEDGIFGIGTADAPGAVAAAIAEHPEPHRQEMGSLCFSWYALAQGERRYRKLPIEVTLGPDLARPLHPLWEVIEIHAEALDCLCRQQAGVTFAVTEGRGTEGPALTVQLPLAERGDFLRIVLDRQDVRYVVQHEGALSTVDPDEETVDRAVYLILAELAATKKRLLVRS